MTTGGAPGGATDEVAPELGALPLQACAAAALQAARDAGATHADVRVERLATRDVTLRDGALENLSDDVGVGLAVRVVHDGTWGFAGSVDVTPDEAVRLARDGVALARTSRPLNSRPVELAPEPVHADARWRSAHDVDPFTVAPRDQVALLGGWSADLLREAGVHHVDAGLLQVKEQKFYADAAGSSTLQERVRLEAELQGVHVDDAGGFESMRTLAPPVGRGWEHLVAPPSQGGWDWAGELAALPGHLAEKVAAASVEPGTYDLVLDPSNLWLTIHESVGHATELDRALGYEAAYAGTSFATPDLLGTLRYGSELMTVTGDRTTPHGLATVGFDDEGVEASAFDLVRDGVLVGYQLDRRTARLGGATRSNGCAYADSPLHVPLQRMANVSLAPAPGGPSTAEIIAGVEHGIYVVGDKSWSIDMQRYNFQFTGQRFYEIRGGQLVRALRDVAYQSSTPAFWASLAALGGPQTYVLGGALNCGKAQPGQVAAVSHGCPTALFRGVTVLNTRGEGR